ncbi:MAG: hypothetical protein CMJ49_03960 [Planctomycetaceae bacterium]|nr:hypothetical protein [Planctomycetaceae bacterium]
MIETMLRVLPTVDALPEPLRRFMDRLTPEQTLLLVLKRDLYGGTWPPMVTDLENRLSGRPYVFRLAHRIEDDLRRIEQMIELERHYEIDLTAYVESIDEMETGR